VKNKYIQNLITSKFQCHKKLKLKLYLSFIVDIASINSFEVQILSDICMDEDTNKSAICHHKLAKQDLVMYQKKLKQKRITAIGGELNSNEERKKTRESKHTP
jgi:hypothetical protein